MCFILVLSGVSERYPLIVAANRDESRSRPTTPPHIWPGEPPLIAGRDELAGGTWLGVNAHGLLAAITNRREEEAQIPSPPPRSPDPSLPSRGGLCLGALRQPTLAAAADYAESELRRSRWNPFNLLCATTDGAWVTSWRGKTWQLGSGVHVVTNEGDVDDRSLPMVKRGHELAAAVSAADASLDALLPALGRVCADTEGPAPICRPSGERGTVSSSLIALGRDGQLAAYWHAVGPPCQTPYAPLSVSLRP